MASGYFPYDHRDEAGKALAAALDQLETVLGTADYDDSQYDNAAADGAAIERLGIAADLIWQCLDFFQNPECQHRSLKYGRCRAYIHYPGGGKREVRCSRCDLPCSPPEEG